MDNKIKELGYELYINLLLLEKDILPTFLLKEYGNFLHDGIGKNLKDYKSYIDKNIKIIHKYYPLINIIDDFNSYYVSKSKKLHNNGEHPFILKGIRLGNICNDGLTTLMDSNKTFFYIIVEFKSGEKINIYDDICKYNTIKEKDIENLLEKIKIILSDDKVNNYIKDIYIKKKYSYTVGYLYDRLKDLTPLSEDEIEYTRSTLKYEYYLEKLSSYDYQFQNPEHRTLLREILRVVEGQKEIDSDMAIEMGEKEFENYKKEMENEKNIFQEKLIKKLDDSRSILYYF